jgi:hypothetical protein
VLRRTVDGTADGLGEDADAWRDVVAWRHQLGELLFAAMLGPVGAPLPLLCTLRRLSGVREGVSTARMLLEPVEAWVQQQFTTDAPGCCSRRTPPMPTSASTRPARCRPRCRS